VPASYYLIEGYAGFAEVYLALWEASGGQMPDRRAALARQARQACEALAHYARTFAIGQPRMWLCQGRAHWLAGRPASAHQAWQKGLVAAERLAMPYEQVLLHYTIGRHSMGLQRREHLQQAEDIARRLNTAHDLARIAELQL
jgi:hypothetical protein